MTFKLCDAAIWHDAVDLSGYANQVALSASAEAKDATTFQSNCWIERTAGLKSADVSFNTFWDATPDAEMFNALGDNTSILTVCTSGTGGSVAYSFTNLDSTYEQGDDVGELVGLNCTASSTGVLYRGKLALAKAARTSASNGTALQLGTVASGEKVYASLHVFAITGGNLAVTVASDDNSGFTSGTDRLTFTTRTTVGAELVSTTGAITDNWWRVSWTQTASSATFAVVVGIQ